MNPTKSSLLSRPQNLLTSWKQECYLLSSPLQIRPLHKREEVDVIYDTLESFFGLQYFKAASVGTPLEKILWIHSLLANPKDLGSFKCLMDIAQLTRYAITLGPSFVQTLQDLKKNTDNLRSYYFEFYTYQLLDNNRIPNVKKPFENDQELEGLCTILGREYLFECRKLYLPGVAELDVRHVVLMELIKHLPRFGKKAQAGMGIIATIKFTDAADKRNKQRFSQRILEFIKRADAHEGFATVDYNHSDEYGTLYITNYFTDRKNKLKNEDECDVYVIIYPAPVPVQDQPVHHRIEGGINHSVLREKTTAKLLSAFKEKRRQHKASGHQGKIYFFDNEILPEFRMALLKEDGMLDKASVQAVVEKCDSEEALCIITRNYMTGKVANSMQVFCKSENKALKYALEALVHSSLK